MPAIRALILDREGTLIEHVPYLHKPADVRVLPGVREGLAAARAAGLKLFLHTNQSGVGDGEQAAPEHPKEPAVYRKPSPRFAREIMAEHGFASGELCYIGDRGSDLETAHAAGTRAVGVATGLDDLEAELREAGLGHYPVFKSFRAAIDHVLSGAA